MPPTSPIISINSSAATLMIDVLGRRPWRLVKRMQAAVTAITEGKGELEVHLCQMVNLLKDGEP